MKERLVSGSWMRGGAFRVKPGPLARRARRPTVCVAVALTLAAAWGATPGQPAPAHLDILSAVVREVPPIDPNAVGSRTVAIELTLSGSPSCTGSSDFMAYGILIDPDQDPGSGISSTAFDPLGVDARITCECDQASSLFVSEAGTVTLGPPGPGGEVLLTITTTVASLPAVEFDWIAFAMEGADFTRLPAAPDFATWAIFERRIP